MLDISIFLQGHWTGQNREENHPLLINDADGFLLPGLLGWTREDSWTWILRPRGLDWTTCTYDMLLDGCLSTV